MKKRRNKSSGRDLTKIEDRLFCVSFMGKLLKFWPITLLLNFGLTWLMLQQAGIHTFFDYLTLVIFPPMLLAGELIFLVLGALAEIPAEMLCDALLPRIPDKNAPAEQEDIGALVKEKAVRYLRSHKAAALALIAVPVLAVGIFLVSKRSADVPPETQPAPVQIQSEPVSTVPATTASSSVSTEIPAETVSPAPVSSGSTGPVDYEIVRWDRSYTDPEGQNLMSYYYDYPVIHSQEEAHQKIGQILYQNAESFMTSRSQESIETPVMSVFNTVTECIDTTVTEVTQNGDGIFSILLTTDYYSGGNHSVENRSGETYSLKTGEKLELSQLTQMDDAQLLQALQDSACDYFEANNPLVFPDARNVISNYTLDNFKFVVQEGQIVLLFKTYQFTPGVAGPQSVPTGIPVQPKE